MLFKVFGERFLFAEEVTSNYYSVLTGKNFGTYLPRSVVDLREKCYNWYDSGRSGFAAKLSSEFRMTAAQAVLSNGQCKWIIFC